MKLILLLSLLLSTAACGRHNDNEPKVTTTINIIHGFIMHDDKICNATTDTQSIILTLCDQSLDATETETSLSETIHVFNYDTQVIIYIASETYPINPSLVVGSITLSLTPKNVTQGLMP